MFDCRVTTIQFECYCFVFSTNQRSSQSKSCLVLREFSRAWRRLHTFDFNSSDWSSFDIALIAFLMARPDCYNNSFDLLRYDFTTVRICKQLHQAGKRKQGLITNINLELYLVSKRYNPWRLVSVLVGLYTRNTKYQYILATQIDNRATRQTKQQSYVVTDR